MQSTADDSKGDISNQDQENGEEEEEEEEENPVKQEANSKQMEVCEEESDKIKVKKTDRKEPKHQAEVKESKQIPEPVQDKGTPTLQRDSEPVQDKETPTSQKDSEQSDKTEKIGHKRKTVGPQLLPQEEGPSNPASEPGILRNSLGCSLPL